MIKGIPTDPEKYTVRCWKDNGAFIAQCEEIPIICVQSELEGEAIFHCRSRILDHINWCLSNDFAYQEPQEEVVESMEYYHLFNFGFMDYLSYLLTDMNKACFNNGKEKGE
jgi:hypothetical protein